MLSGRRPALSLVELLVAIVLLGIVGGAVMSVVIRQQRFYRDAEWGIQRRTATREALALLGDDLRSLSPRAGDLYTIAPGAVELRATLGAAVACTIDSIGGVIVVPPDSLATGLPLTTFATAPRAGDTVLAHDVAADTWRPHVLVADPSRGGNCPVASGFTTTSAEAVRGWTLRVAPPVTSGAGTALRFVRRVRYQLYKASDARWYLGWLDCQPARAVPCATIQPVSGPYEPGGIHFDWLDGAGAPAPSPAAVARIDVLAVSRGAVATPAADTLALSIAPRN
jgi:type II secretory pathway pseudopilin PulG